MSSRHHHLIAPALAAVLAAGCAGNPASLGISQVGAIKRARPAAAKAAPLIPLPAVAERAFADSDGTGNISGSAGFVLPTNDFFADSAANYRIQATMPTAHALVTLSTLEEAQYRANGTAISTMSDPSGQFSLTGVGPTIPFVVNANVVGGHRLSAIALPGQPVTVNEASTMVTEMARWQLRSQPVPTDHAYYDPAIHDGRFTLPELVADPTARQAFDDVQAHSATLAAGIDLGAGTRTIEALKTGAGHLLRNRYVEAFGQLVSQSGNTVADRLSDAWTRLLGFRPLGLTRAVGNGLRTYDQSDNKPATETGLIGPMDAITNQDGHMFIAEEDANLIRVVPQRTAMAGGFLQQSDTMAAGHLYVVAGYIGSPTRLDDFEALYADAEYESIDTPEAAPALEAGADTPLFTPHKLVTAQAAGGGTHLFFTSKFGHRLFFVPGSDHPTNGDGSPLFGRDFLKGRLYTVAGFADPTTIPLEDYGDYSDAPYPGDGGRACDALLSSPTGLARDTAGNLFVLDAGLAWREGGPANDPSASLPNAGGVQGYHGTVRVVRASDGQIFALHFRYQDDWVFEQAHDLRLSPDGSEIYVVDTEANAIFKFPTPDVAQLDHSNPVIDLEAPGRVVLGSPDLEQGPAFLAPGVRYPDIYDVSAGYPATQARLYKPSSLEFMADNSLLVADSGNGRLRLLKGGKLYTVAGGLDSRSLTGDARLGFFPKTTYLHRVTSGAASDPARDSVLLVDYKESIVRRLHSGRGFF